MNIENQELIAYLNEGTPLKSFTCPHCSTYSNLYADQLEKITFKINNNIEGTSLAIHCPKCDKTSIFLITTSREIRGKEYIIFNFISEKVNSIKQIYPKEKSIAKTFPDYIPSQLITLYEEMCELYPINNNATAIWARKWVEKFIVIESSKLKKNALKGSTLNEKITSFNEINNTTLDTNILTALRRIGNKTIHIVSSNEDVEITKDESFLIIRNIEFIIDYYYVIPHNKKESENELLALEDKVVKKSNTLEKEEKQS